MPPPYRYDPFKRAAAEVYDEPLPARFFSARGQQASPWESDDMAAQTRLELDEIDSHRDDAATKMAQNMYNRLLARDRAKLLPFSTAADIAAAQTRKQKEELDFGVDPFQAETARETAITGAATSAATRNRIPENMELADAERQARLESLATADPQQDRLGRITKSPRAQVAYESFLRESDPKIPKSQRQQSAFNRALELEQDEGSVEAIETMLLDNPDAQALRKKLIQDHKDASGRYLGSTIHKDADIGEVNALVRRHESARQRQSLAREERMANFGYSRMVNDQQEDIARRIKALVDAGEPDAPEMAGLKKEQDDLALLRAQLLKDLNPGTPKPVAAPAAGNPAPVPAAQVPAATPSAPPVKSVLEKWKETFKK